MSYHSCLYIFYSQILLCRLTNDLQLFDDKMFIIMFFRDCIFSTKLCVFLGLCILVIDIE